jgi:class 3 adenylate cyclase
MSELPAGTVTFLFSDMQGSTQLLQQLGPDQFREKIISFYRQCSTIFLRMYTTHI